MEWSEADAKLFNDVQKHGWHVVIVADQPWFAYTVGLYARYSKPEIVVFGLRKEDLHAVCNAYGTQVKGGERPTPAEYLGSEAVLRAVDPKLIGDYFGTAKWFYRGREFPMVQLIWSDPEGLFPWDEKCDPAVRTAQPIVG